MSVGQDASSEPAVQWHLEPRPYHHGYEEGAEAFGGALKQIMEEVGCRNAEAFSTWVYEQTGGNKSGIGTSPYAVDLPPPLLEAAIWPALGWESMGYVIDCVAQALKVSPGTLLDELWSRASFRNGDGTCFEGEHEWGAWSHSSSQAGSRACERCGAIQRG